MSSIFRASTATSTSFVDYYTKDETRKRFASRDELENTKSAKLDINDNPGSNSQFTGKLKIVGELEANTITALQTSQTADALVAIGTGNDVVSGDLVTGVYTKAKISSITYWPGWIYNTANRLIHLLESTTDINTLTPSSTFLYANFKCGELTLASTGRLFYPNSNSICNPTLTNGQFFGTGTNDLVLNSINGNIHIGGGGLAPGIANNTSTNTAPLVVGTTITCNSNLSLASGKRIFPLSTDTSIMIAAANGPADIMTNANLGDLCIQGKANQQILLGQGVNYKCIINASAVQIPGANIYKWGTISDTGGISMTSSIIRGNSQNNNNLFLNSTSGDLLIALTDTNASAKSIKIGCINSTNQSLANSTVAAAIVINASNNTTFNGTVTHSSTTALNDDTTMTTGKMILFSNANTFSRIGVNAASNGVLNGTSTGDLCFGLRGADGNIVISANGGNANATKFTTNQYTSAYTGLNMNFTGNQSRIQFSGSGGNPNYGIGMVYTDGNTFTNALTDDCYIAGNNSRNILIGHSTALVNVGNNTSTVRTNTNNVGTNLAGIVISPGSSNAPSDTTFNGNITVGSRLEFPNHAFGTVSIGNLTFNGSGASDLYLCGKSTQKILIGHNAITNYNFSGGSTYAGIVISPGASSAPSDTTFNGFVTINSGRLLFPNSNSVSVPSVAGNQFTSTGIFDLVLNSISGSVHIGTSGTAPGTAGSIKAGIVVSAGTSDTTLNGNLTMASTKTITLNNSVISMLTDPSRLEFPNHALGTVSSSNLTFNGSTTSDLYLCGRSTQKILIGHNSSLIGFNNSGGSINAGIVISPGSSTPSTTKFNGDVTMGAALFLPTSGGTAANLNHYEENPSNTFVYSISGASSSATGIEFNRFGKIVSVLFYSVLLTTGGTTTATITAGTTIPSRFFPKADFSKMVPVRSGTTYSTGLLKVSSTGTVTIQYTIDGTTNWPISTANSGLAFNENVTWNVA